METSGEVPAALTDAERRRQLKAEKKWRKEEREKEIELKKHIFRSQFPMVTISFPNWITDLLDKQTNRHGADADAHSDSEASGGDDDETGMAGSSSDGLKASVPKPAMELKVDGGVDEYDSSGLVAMDEEEEIGGGAAARNSNSIMKQIVLMTRIFTILSSVKMNSNLTLPLSLRQQHREDDKTSAASVAKSTSDMYDNKLESLVESCPDIPLIYASIIRMIGLVSCGKVTQAMELILLANEKDTNDTELNHYIVDFAMCYCQTFESWKSLLSQLLNLIRQLNGRCLSLRKKVDSLKLEAENDQSERERKKLEFEMKLESGEAMDMDMETRDELVMEFENQSEIEIQYESYLNELEKGESEHLFIQDCYRKVWYHLSRLSSIGGDVRSATASGAASGGSGSGGAKALWLSVTDLIGLVPDDGNLAFFAPIFVDFMRHQSADLMNVALFEKVVRMERDKDAVLSQQIHKLDHLPEY